MKTYRKWFFWAIFFIILVVGSLGLANYIGDPYGLFKKDFSFQFIEPSGAFIKARYLSKHADKYDCLIFGSSRVGRLDPEKIEGRACFNMNTSGSLPEYNLHNLQYFLKKGMKPKLLLLGLDEFSYTVNPKEYLEQPMRWPYPPTMGERVLPFYLKYLFSPFSREVWEQVLKGYVQKWRSGQLWAKNDEGYQRTLKTGYTSNIAEDKRIENDPAEHEKKLNMLPPFAMPTLCNDGANIEGSLAALQNIVQIADTQGIKLVIFINPIHKATYLSKNLENFITFRKGLSKITSYWDFSGLNSITTNHYYYYEPSHYRTIVGDMMLNRMLGAPRVSIPPDFGVYVTPQNIEAHLKKLRAEAPKN